jgi:hypothetical protein
MKKILLAVLCLGFIGIGACHPSKAGKMKTVRKRAPFDLSCPGHRISYVSLGETSQSATIGASGCGKKMTYVVDCGTTEDSSCKAVANLGSKQ